MGPNRDIVAIAKSGKGSNFTKFYISSAASNYKTWIEHLSPLPKIGDDFEFLMAQNRDIVVIQKSGTGTNSTEVHILSAVRSD